MESSQQSSPEASLAGLKLKHSLRHPPFQRLASVTSVEDFKTIFIDMVKTHRAIYEVEGSVVSLSHSNVMFTDTSEPRAVLVSLDPPPGMELGTDHYIQKRDAPSQHPFLAYDHTFSRSAPHLDYLYRHHLESFFYILLYCCEQYTSLPPEPSHYPMYGNCFTDWFERYESSGHHTKGTMYHECYQDFYRSRERATGLSADPEIQLWLKGFWDIFKDVTTTRYDPQEGPVGWRSATLNGRVTFEEFMAVLAGRGRVIITDRSCAPRCAVFMP